MAHDDDIKSDIATIKISLNDSCDWRRLSDRYVTTLYVNCTNAPRFAWIWANYRTATNMKIDEAPPTADNTMFRIATASHCASVIVIVYTVCWSDRTFKKTGCSFMASFRSWRAVQVKQNRSNLKSDQHNTFMYTRDDAMGLFQTVLRSFISFAAAYASQHFHIILPDRCTSGNIGDFTFQMEPSYTPLVIP